MEEVSDVEVTFLQVNIKKIRGRIVVAPHFKRAKLGMPLEASSGHPGHIHERRPLAQLRMMRQLSTRRIDAEAARRTIVERFTKFLAPQRLIRALQVDDIWSNHPKAKNRGRDDNAHRTTVFLPLPFHPAWHRPVSGAIRALNSHPVLYSLWGMAFGDKGSRIMASWKNEAPSLFQMLQL